MPRHGRTADQKEKKKKSLQKQCAGCLKARHGHAACFPSPSLFFLLRGEFKNYVLCYPQGNPLITVIQVFAEILKHAGKWGLFAHAKTVLYGNESAM